MLLGISIRINAYQFTIIARRPLIGDQTKKLQDVCTCFDGKKLRAEIEQTDKTNCKRIMSELQRNNRHQITFPKRNRYKLYKTISKK